MALTVRRLRPSLAEDLLQETLILIGRGLPGFEGRAQLKTWAPSLSRACHGEAFFVPHSAMASWVKGAEKTLMIDGCFLKCHGRVLHALVGREKVVHVDALPLYNKFTNVFSMDDVAEDERRAVARQVADKIIARLEREGVVPGKPR